MEQAPRALELVWVPKQCNRLTALAPQIRRKSDCFFGVENRRGQRGPLGCAGMASATNPESAGKPALSSKLMGLKFMQRASNKNLQKEAAKEPAKPVNEVRSWSLSA